MSESKKPSVEDALAREGFAPVPGNENGELFSRVAYILPIGLKKLLGRKFEGQEPDVVIVKEAKAHKRFGLVRSRKTTETYYAHTEEGELKEVGKVKRSFRAQVWAFLFGKKWDTKSRDNIYVQK